MDQLTLDCIAARKAGMSYGEYMASRYQAPVIETDVQPVQNERACLTCGKTISKYEHANRRYCSEGCRYERAREYYREKYHDNKMQDNAENKKPQKVCRRCGKEIPKHMHGGNRYCSLECRHERDNELKRALWAKNKDKINARRRAKRNGEI